MNWFRKAPVVRTFTGASAELTAMHFMDIKPEPHQHTWKVRVWTEKWIDVRTLEFALSEELKPLQAKNLNAFVPSGSAEHLARRVYEGLGLGVFRVEVEREGRFLAVVEGPALYFDESR